ncbi:MAG: pyridoxamine 5'-phosphate oxidase family protein [Treponema sp.]|jgi:uncharacterized pyridoxamine 5'-phosphate oxidase family protein|nr:pyridoxamine 5'-phosphate oxidase family protein [Treponema sp.]
MKEVIRFLNDCKVYYLATLDGDQPRVRPLGFVMEYDGKLSFCTNNKKDMFKQMKLNPRVEISTASSDGKTLRITGTVGFNPSRAAREKALEIMPLLGNMYSVDDGMFEIFYIDQGSAVITDMTGVTSLNVTL